MLAGGTVFGWVTFSPGSGRRQASTIPLSRRQVISILFIPIPEAPRSLLFVRHAVRSDERPLDQILGLVPVPLPAPTPQGDCPGGGDLIIHLRGGRTVTY